MAAGTKNKKLLGYALYVFLVSVFLLYFLFPTQVFEEVLANGVSRLNAEFNFKAEKIRPWIPAGLKIKSARVYLSEKQKPEVFRTDTLYIGTDILKLLKGEYGFELLGRAYKGELEGALRFSPVDRALTVGELNFKNISLADYGFLNENFTHRITGSLSGEIIINGESSEVGKENAQADLRLSDGLLQFKEPIFNITSVDLKQIKVEAHLNGQVLTITKAELEGSEINGSLTGSIELQKNIGRSQINLKGTLEPLAEFYRKYPEIREILKTMKKRMRRGQYYFVLTGTLANPQFSLQ